MELGETNLFFFVFFLTQYPDSEINVNDCEGWIIIYDPSVWEVESSPRLDYEYEIEYKYDYRISNQWSALPESVSS